MPAKFVKSYQSPDGKIFSTLGDEQKHELTCIICGEKQPTDSETKIVETLLANIDKVVDCLKQKERQRVREGKPARKKKEKAAAAPAA